MTKLSKSQIDKLGERLRAAAEPSETDLRELNALLEAHQPALLAAGRAVHDLVSDFRIVAVRLKSARSTIEKLKRTPSMTLRQMQDLAGVRIVVGGGRNEQDGVVALLAGHFNSGVKSVMVSLLRNPRRWPKPSSSRSQRSLGPWPFSKNLNGSHLKGLRRREN